jgi:hypothetical protein
VPSDCILRSASCCGQCGAATRGDAIAVNVAHQSDYASSVCGTGTACPECASPQDPTLGASCQSGKCAVVDLQVLPLTECQSDSDCRIRTRDCCECGGNVSLESLIAIRNDAEAAYAAIACDPGQGCDDCMPVYPVGATAACFGGRCTVNGNSGTTPI